MIFNINSTRGHTGSLLVITKSSKTIYFEKKVGPRSGKWIVDII